MHTLPALNTTRKQGQDKCLNSFWVGNKDFNNTSFLKSLTLDWSEFKIYDQFGNVFTPYSFLSEIRSEMLMWCKFMIMKSWSLDTENKIS